MHEALSYARQFYSSKPRLYSLVELLIVLGAYFSIVWPFRLCVFGLYYSIFSGSVCILVFSLSFLVHADTLPEIGIRFDNIPRSLKECGIATLLSIAIIISIFLFFDPIFMPRTFMSILANFSTYIGGGIFQQFFLNSFLLLRIKEISRSNIIAVPIAAVLFSLMHAPDWKLMLLTLLGGLLFCILFLRNRNIFTLGLTHATVATAFFVFLIPGLISNFQIGLPGGELYNSYGRGATVAAGDVNGDGKDELLIGKGPHPDNDTEILVRDEKGVVLNTFRAFEKKVRYGVLIAAGDINGDGIDEIIAAKGPHYTNDTLIKVLDGKGHEIAHFTAFPCKKFGANVAAGDIDGDGLDEIITAPGPGQGYKPVIRVFNGNGRIVREFEIIDFVDQDDYFKKIRHGLQVGSGDIDGDGRDEILLGLAHIRVYRAYVAYLDFDNSTNSFIQNPWVLAYIPGAIYGINLASGDIDGDGLDEIITGPGPSKYSGDHLRIFNSRWESIFKAFPFELKYGLNVASGDLDADGIDEVIAAPGPGENYKVEAKIIDVQKRRERKSMK